MKRVERAKCAVSGFRRIEWLPVQKDGSYLYTEHTVTEGVTFGIEVVELCSRAKWWHVPALGATTGRTNRQAERARASRLTSGPCRCQLRDGNLLLKSPPVHAYA